VVAVVDVADVVVVVAVTNTNLNLHIALHTYITVHYSTI
jgi:hypothetical protein